MPPIVAVPRVSGRVVWLAIGIALGAAIILGITTLSRPQPIRPLSTLLSVELSSGPLDAEFNGSVGYVSLGEGTIVQVEVSSDAIDVTEVIGGLAYPRGIAVGTDELYVAELGQLPCAAAYPVCKGPDVDDDAVEGERQIVEGSSARILAYPIIGDGFARPRVVVDRLPVVNTEHGLNDLDLGPDGMLYATLGYFDSLRDEESMIAGLQHPRAELVGTVLRIDPLSGKIEIYAQGLRNVYGLAFDGDDLYGVDNDGPTRGSRRYEELLHIEGGRNYGHPDEGTLGPHSVRDGHPIGIVSGTGSAGILVQDSSAFVGSCGQVHRMELNESHAAVTSSRVISRQGGCVTAIVALPDGRMLITVFGEASHVVVLD